MKLTKTRNADDHNGIDAIPLLQNAEVSSPDNLEGDSNEIHDNYLR
jgi:hypothetical protein